MNRRVNHVVFWAILLATVGIGLASTAPMALNSLIIPANLDESSFPATGITTRGGIVFGADAGLPYWSPGDGGAWQAFVTPSQITNSAPGHLSGFFPGALLSNGVVVQESRFTTPATFTRLTGTIMVAGSDGAHTFTIDVFDKTDGGVLCVSSAVTCNTAVSSFGGACTLGPAALDDVDVRVNDAACLVTAPILNLAAEYH